MRKKFLKHLCRKVHKKRNYPRFVHDSFDDILDDMEYYKICLSTAIIDRICDYHDELHREYDKLLVELKKLDKNE